MPSSNTRENAAKRPSHVLGSAAAGIGDCDIGMTVAAWVEHVVWLPAQPVVKHRATSARTLFSVPGIYIKFGIFASLSRPLPSKESGSVATEGRQVFQM